MSSVFYARFERHSHGEGLKAQSTHYCAGCGHGLVQKYMAEAIDENAEAPVIRGNVLNLGELLRQSLLLAAPSLPTCPQDCSRQVRWTSEGAPEADNPLKKLGAIWAARGQEQ